MEINIYGSKIKLLEDNIGGNLDDLRYGDDLLHKTTKVQLMNEMTDKLNFIKIKNVCSVKDRTMTERRYLQRTHLIRDCYLKCTKNS